MKFEVKWGILYIYKFLIFNNFVYFIDFFRCCYVLFIINILFIILKWIYLILYGYRDDNLNVLIIVCLDYLII